MTAIQDSVDTFFYNLGGILDLRPIATYDHANGGELQKWASDFGIGRPTGVDLPGESTGSMASPGYFKQLWNLQEKCLRTRPRPAGGCNIADTPDWTIGDNVNAAVGQGDVTVTPLQLAVVYSAIANGGNIITPRLAESLQSPTGLTLHTLGSFPKQVYGKTGTAQYFNAQNQETDYAWYACYVPATATSKPIVVVVWVQKGGFGDVAAAPVAKMILGQWFFGKPGKFQVGANTTL